MIRCLLQAAECHLLTHLMKISNQWVVDAVRMWAIQVSGIALGHILQIKTGECYDLTVCTTEPLTLGLLDLSQFYVICDKARDALW